MTDAQISGWDAQLGDFIKISLPHHYKTQLTLLPFQ
jgi:hypothetical protein